MLQNFLTVGQQVLILFVLLFGLSLSSLTMVMPMYVGAVLRPENIRCLKQNGKIYFINAGLDRLRATSDRPLSDTDEKLAALYAQRMDVYRATADVIVPDMPMPEAEAAYILKKRLELIV